MKSASGMPSDLDYQAKKKWLELIGCVDVDADSEMLANYCRQHSSLLAIRRERTRQQKSGKFQTMVKGRDGTQALNPLLIAENRMVASLNRMLKGLGLASSRDDSTAKRPLPASRRPAWAAPDEPEPKCGWDIEAIMCGLKAWDPHTLAFEDVPESSPEHPDHPNFKPRGMTQ